MAAAKPQRQPAPAPALAAVAAAPEAAPPLPDHLPLRAPLPAQDLSGLEAQLRKITDQIETLRRPAIEEAINALRAELADIGHALNEAMPRQAIDTIERQISTLSQRIAEGRQSGNMAGADSTALAGVEHGLAEVRDALRGLTPAENLVGFGDAVANLEQKIDLIVAQRDPATLAQLESAINTLRGMASSVASNETVGKLAGEVQTLASRVEELSRSGAAGDALSGLEQRIDALAAALAERSQNGGSVPPQLDALVHSLADKIEQIQHSRTEDSVAVGHLEDRIVRLVEKLDASDSRLTHLEAIERGLADLLVHIEELRAAKAPAASNAAAPGVDSLKHDIARTQDALDAVHGTLGLVVDRLATIEKNMQERPPAAPAPLAAVAPQPAMPLSPPSPVFDDDEPLELTQPVGKIGVRAVSDAPPPLPPSASPPLNPPMPPAPPSARMPPVTPLTVTPPPAAPTLPATPAAPRRATRSAATSLSLPEDQPLEPGSGPPPRGNPAARIAASDAALGGARPAPQPAGATSSFIQAARRAAQAARQQEPAPRAADADDDDFDGGGAQPTLRSKMMRRVKSLFIAASIIAVVVGSVQIAGRWFHVGNGARTTSQRVGGGGADKLIVAPPTKAPNADALAIPPMEPAAPTNLLPPPTAPQKASELSGPSLLAPPMLGAPDVTGSIPMPARNNSKAAPAAAANEELPAAIGSVHLRHAAMSGDAAAAYEVAMRYAEGRGVPANPPEAARWFERAASKGLAPAQFRYASMLEKGQGVSKDLPAARRLYLAAAEQGNAKSMHNLAVLYAEGADGKPDYPAAAKWFEKAAQAGVSDSQYNLGILYARGIGVTKNMAESYKWFALAAKHGDNESGKKRDEVAASLDAKELAAARHAVDTFAATPQPAAAITVPAPAGGWDRAEAKPTPAAPKTKPARPVGPLSLGAYTVGSR
jgi:localization factor PodJL